MLSNADDSLYTYPVEGRLLFPDKSTPPTTKLTLNAGEYETFSRFDGSFTFHDVKPGVYLLDVLSTTVMFSQVKLNLPNDPEGKVRCLEYRYPGAMKQPISYPLDLMAHVKIKYFEVRESFGIHTILKNPMSYMAIFSLFFIIVFPKMMNSMDPEQMKEMQDQMAENDPSAVFSQMFGGGNKKDDDWILDHVVRTFIETE